MDELCSSRRINNYNKKKGEEDMNVTTNGACPRSYVAQIFRYAYVGHGGDRKTFESVRST